MLPVVDLIGICATAIDMINLWPQFKHIRDTNNTSSYSLTHIKVSLFTSILWMFYAFKKKDKIMMATGMIGFMFTCYVFCKATKRTKQA